MAVKYVVIDLSKIDPNQLSQLLTEAYEAGYKAGKENIGKLNDVPSIPYYGDNWSLTCTANTIDPNSVSSRSTGISLGADTSSVTDKINTLSSVVSSIDTSN